jgi:hypothetical protein
VALTVKWARSVCVAETVVSESSGKAIFNASVSNNNVTGFLWILLEVCRTLDTLIHAHLQAVHAVRNGYDRNYS